MLPSSPNWNVSLRLGISAEFEVNLLEIALKGKNAFETFKDIEGADWDTRKLEMWNEISQDIEHYEKNGNLKRLEERGKDLVTRIEKSDSNLYKRVTVVYNNILERKLSQENLDVNFEKMLNTELPALEESKIDGLSPMIMVPPGRIDGLSIFDSPLAKSKEVIKFPNVSKTSTAHNFTEKHSLGTKSRLSKETVFVVPWILDDDLGAGSNNENTQRDMDNAKQLRCYWKKDNLEEVLNIEYDDDDLKVHYEAEKMVLGEFPEPDFKAIVEWTVGQQTFKVNTIAELRRKHNVLIEGDFRKRCKGLKWREYFGFFMDNGTMIYFRDGNFKKVADFRESTISKMDDKYSRLTIEGVNVDNSKLRDWLLEFKDVETLVFWYRKFKRFCKGISGNLDCSNI